jgi:MOSC domain
VSGEVIAARTIEGVVRGVYRAPPDDFVSAAVDTLALTYDGIPDDRHAGTTRLSGAREPWYPRGTPMRNERQLSILSEEELAEIAASLGIPSLPPEWIGGNLLLGGIPRLSLLPPRSILMFASGAAVRIDGDNGPCRSSGRSIAAQSGVSAHEFAFVQTARHKRGLVGWVEREGTVNPGDAVKIRIWEQAIYAG